MYLLIIFITFLSASVTGLFGRKIGTKGAGLFSSICIIISAGVAYYIFYEVVLCGSVVFLKLGKWINTDILIISFGLQFDSLTAIMLVIITSISAMVHIFSLGYMKEDPHIPRFMSYLSLFTFLMIVLVTSDNYLQLFIGWEGVGLCSYLLINFWFTRIQANKAAIKAMLINRVGDMGLILAIFLILKYFGSLEFEILSNIYLEENSKQIIEIICLLLFIATIGKSAQLGLHTWLPDAMEGPTPVSALIHAATMVTAGVFLVIRSAFLFETAPLISILMSVIGGLTAFISATIGLVQNDLKKVIAYSTCSQLGYMVMICGVSYYSVSLFHLVNHAFFKALLFLSAGAIIHAVNDEQDIRKMGGLIKPLPLIFIITMIGALSLMGTPYLTGFYSKDLILELIYGKYIYMLIYWLASMSALLTAFYSMRLIYLVFITNTNIKKEIFIRKQKVSLYIIMALMGLVLGSIFNGFIMKEVLLSNMVTPFINTHTKMIPILFSIVGGVSAFFIYNNFIKYRLYHVLYTFINSAWQFNYLMNHFLTKSLWKFGYYISYKIVDRGVLEIIGPRGLIRVFTKLTKKLSKLQSGNLFNYAFIMIIFVLIYLII
uniref:NADH-ubiquinone oxidoreductase chain 5 n=1 Tax=Igernella notabilis TaxID=479643 RepID=I6LIR8_9METZ|nr:NADH dehydrogenase subunit 5 [Igernella notabilis]ABW83949.1 NADH dehydrogenase subunit 5 [Igernella notabilis]